MKRDFNLIRKILLDVEKAPPGKAVSGLVYETHEEATVNEHIKLLIDANFLEGKIDLGIEYHHDGSHQIILWYEIYRLTWEGHNFLDNAKNEIIWKKVMADAEKKGMSLSMSVLNGLLTKAAEKYMGLA